jgi:addiction module HigA family antidote
MVAPGEVLREELLVSLRLSARALACDLRVPPDRIPQIVNGQRAISAQTAILLGARFGRSAEFWMNLQVAHDLEEARRRMGKAA